MNCQTISFDRMQTLEPTVRTQKAFRNFLFKQICPNFEILSIFRIFENFTKFLKFLEILKIYRNFEKLPKF